MARSKLRVAVLGAAGRMGRASVAAVRRNEDLELVGEIEKSDDLRSRLRECAPDVAIDFTTPDAVERNVRTCLEARVHPVVGTTGLDASVLESLVGEAARCGVGGVIAPNFAIGAVLMMGLAERAARFLGEVEIVEYHHPRKIDAPSGTSLMTRERIRAVRGVEAPIHSVRLEGFLAHQEVIFGGPGERLTIRHDTLDRECFMPGVILAVRAAPELEKLVVGLEHLLDRE